MTEQLHEENTAHEDTESGMHTPNPLAAFNGSLSAKRATNPAMPLSEIRSLDRVLDEQDARLNRMIARWWLEMFRLAASRWTGRLQEVDDIVQSACIQAWEQRAELGLLKDGQPIEGRTGTPRLATHDLRLASADAQFKHCLVHHVILAVRRAKYRAVSDPAWIEIPIELPAQPTKGDFRRTYADRIAMLNPKLRQVLLMHLQGWSNREIAKRIGYKGGGGAQKLVSTRLEQAKARLRVLMGEMDPRDIDGACYDAISARAVYFPAKQPWVSWKNMHPGDLVLSWYSVRQCIGVRELALSDPDRHWNAMWKDLAGGDYNETPNAVPPEFRYLCLTTQK